MKNLKLTLGALLLTSVFFYACEKEKTVTEAQEPVVSENDELIFTAPDPADADLNEEQLRRILEGTYEGKEEAGERDASTCCGITSLARVTWGSLINLNLKYDVNDTDQEMRMKSWVNTGSGWSYWGQLTLHSTYDECTHKSLNIGLGVPSGARVISWARVWDGDSNSYCGASKFLVWNNFL